MADNQVQNNTPVARSVGRVSITGISFAGNPVGWKVDYNLESDHGLIKVDIEVGATEVSSGDDEANNIMKAADAKLRDLLDAWGRGLKAIERR